ncbi:uncharacterized protein LOC129591350 isoform X2 [Paramacrobiotus metropolitanus]|uniref:uncharacterized protein LOC129591350 isoform X2 n=1 Tax=Paramacrobiotus metropolitanus TaxID=2943436 RepID=UPI0024461B44|nr:uncharacterized protein LOC129591350 isoform X2 [Paramacrobiotus metropolitanus]
MQMQFSWRTITPGNIPLASHHRVIRTSRILNVFPSFQILTFFNLIPRHETVENGTFCQRFHRISIWRVVTTFTIFTFLALLLLHDIIYFFMDKAFWTSYMQSDNRIVTLLVSVRYILIFIKNCTAVFVFALKSRNMSIYLTRMNALVAKLRITRRQEKSGCTLEFLQTLAHKRHMMRAEQLSSTSHNPSDAVDNMEIISLAAFLQRAYTKPLTISAGGFMDLTRSFVISVGAVIIGFTIFLMERVESQVDLSTGTGTLCHNSSRPFMRVIREIRPVII